jgi:hypothetical protein
MRINATPRVTPVVPVQPVTLAKDPIREAYVMASMVKTRKVAPGRLDTYA